MELIVFDKYTEAAGIKAAEDNDAAALMRELICFSERAGVTEDAWREYAVTALADCRSVLCELAEKGLEIGEDLYKAALSDAERIFDFINACDIKYRPAGNPNGIYSGYRRSIERLVAANNAKELLDGVIEHYRSLGHGVLAKYIAFTYDGALHGVTKTDKQTFDRLVGLEHQKKVLIDNAKAFVEGRASNNVLLFGDRGTGKSSSVKALLNMFYEDGLRIIEMPKHFINDIPKLTEYLSGRANKYIIFLDDLSFDTRDPECRALKIAMDGQVQAQPDNVRIYATSNRRHLIKESWADREGGDVHMNDNMQETLALSERFGISLVFSAPNQREYLNIVSSLLKEKGIEPDAELEKRAIVWQMNYGGRSGRCAKQFVASVVKG